MDERKDVIVFMRDDARICRETATYFRQKDGMDGPDAQWMDGLADRIEVLLPPEEK